MGGLAVEQHPNFSPVDRARGTLKLTNLSLEMSGLYVCVAENRAGSAKCSIVLEVHSSEYVSAGLGPGRGGTDTWSPRGPCGVPVGIRGEANSPPPPVCLSPAASTKAVIAGAVLGSLGALATVIFFAQRVVGYRRKKRDSQEEAANEIK